MDNKFVFFLDLDGTLTENGVLSEENLRAIDRARAQGHAVYLSTGRAPAFIPEWVRKSLKNRLDGIIAGSGAYIEIGGEVVQALTMDSQTVAGNCAFLKKTGRRCILEGISEVLVLNPGENPEFPVIEDGEDFLARHPGCKVEKLNLRGRLNFAEKRYFSMFYTVIQHEGYAECSIPAADKGSALEFVMSRYPDYRSVAVGDSPNDLPMLARADFSVAMGSAPDSVRHVCTHETLPADQAGVAAAICGFLDKTGDFAGV